MVSYITVPCKRTNRHHAVTGHILYTYMYSTIYCTRTMYCTVYSVHYCILYVLYVHVLYYGGQYTVQADRHFFRMHFCAPRYSTVQRSRLSVTASRSCQQIFVHSSSPPCLSAVLYDYCKSYKVNLSLVTS